ncbi:MAG TPA: hypothetical protein VN181_09205 [Thermoanaerobaculia bacterium]|nr:hypothetical protein [Thermoanaerobaculia bacterium]
MKEQALTHASAESSSRVRPPQLSQLGKLRREPPAPARSGAFHHDFSSVPTIGKSGVQATNRDYRGPQSVDEPWPENREYSGPTSSLGPTLDWEEVLKSERDCGAFRWVTQWKLGSRSLKGGWVVQHVAGFAHNITICGEDHKPFTPTNESFWEPSSFPFWEAWRVDEGENVTKDAVRGDREDDSYSPLGAPNTEGSLTISARSEFYEGLTLPPAFRVDAKSPARDLPTTRSNPSLSGGTGAVAHNVRASWNCCDGGEKRKTKVVGGRS